MTAGTTSFTWITAHDRTEHAVSDAAEAARVAAGRGVFEALCSLEFLPAAMEVGPSRRCQRCAAYLRARNNLRDINERMRSDPRPNWLAWLPSQQHGRHAA